MDLEKFLQKVVEMSDVDELIESRRQKLTSDFARMTDEELGEWLVAEEDTTRAGEDAVRLVGEERLAEALGNVNVIDTERLLVDVAYLVLEEHEMEAYDVKMPEALDINDECFPVPLEEIAEKMQKSEPIETAQALIILQGEELQMLLRKLFIHQGDVAKILVLLYNDIMSD